MINVCEFLCAEKGETRLLWTGFAFIYLQKNPRNLSIAGIGGFEEMRIFNLADANAARAQLSCGRFPSNI